MLTAMSHMVENKRLNIGIYAVSALVFVGAFAAIRVQAFVGDEQLSLSMIPHHSIAIKNGERATLRRPGDRRTLRPDCRGAARGDRTDAGHPPALNA
ncbi:MAG: hypothetical protein GEU74_06575 [Nitriliruptorales bacterium]|nr:hypothetical protein [Nitriliruptorales bacterium]